jgi:hypothetical protein
VLRHPFEKDVVAGEGLFEPADGPAAPGVERFRRAGVPDVGLVFNRTNLPAQTVIGDGPHPDDELRVGQTAGDNVAVAGKVLEIRRRKQAIRGSGHNELHPKQEEA